MELALNGGHHLTRPLIRIDVTGRIDRQRRIDGEIGVAAVAGGIVDRTAGIKPINGAPDGAGILLAKRGH